MKKSELLEKLKAKLEKLNSINYEELDMKGKIILVVRKDLLKEVITDIECLNAL